MDFKIWWKQAMNNEDLRTYNSDDLAEAAYKGGQLSVLDLFPKFEKFSELWDLQKCRCCPILSFHDCIIDHITKAIEEQK